MNSKRSLVDFAATLTTLAETGTAIASMVYLALGSDMDRYNAVIRLMRTSDAAVVTSETLTITYRGRALATKIQEIVDQAA